MDVLKMGINRPTDWPIPWRS